jgi:hypothetical protein
MPARVRHDLARRGALYRRVGVASQTRQTLADAALAADRATAPEVVCRCPTGDRVGGVRDAHRLATAERSSAGSASGRGPRRRRRVADLVDASRGASRRSACAAVATLVVVNVGEGGDVDFFVSHAGPDREWAVWVDAQLRGAGYSTITDVYDFRLDFGVKRRRSLRSRPDRRPVSEQPRQPR